MFQSECRVFDILMRVCLGLGDEERRDGRGLLGERERGAVGPGHIKKASHTHATPSDQLRG